MKLLDLLAEALNAEKEAALKAKFVNPSTSKDEPMGMNMGDPRKISEREFKTLVDSDPTANGNYLQWMLTRYTALDRTERKRFIQDGHNESVKELLTFFDRFKQRIAKVDPSVPKDINQFKSLNDFENKLGAVKAKIEGVGEEENLGPEKFKFMKNIKAIGSVDGFVVYRVPQSCKNNKECEAEYQALTGCGDLTQRFEPSRAGEEAPNAGYRVQWCTRNTDKFNFYLTSGPYYIFKNWDKRRQYQLHYETGQFMDEADQPLGRYYKDLENKFLQFLLDKEGRIPPASFNFSLDLSKFQKGQSPNGYSVYEIGDKLYMDFGDETKDKLFYYDEDTNKLKTQDGKDAGTKVIVRMPYMDLVKFAYTKGKKIPALYRLLLNLDIPAGTVIPNVPSLNLSDSDISSLPANMTINGDLDLTNSKLRELPDNLTVTGILSLSGTDLKPKPDTKAGKIVR
jgi:hypothetical protein